MSNFWIFSFIFCSFSKNRFEIILWKIGVKLKLKMYGKFLEKNWWNITFAVTFFYKKSIFSFFTVRAGQIKEKAQRKFIKKVNKITKIKLLSTIFHLEYFFIFTLKIFSLKIKTKKNNNMGKNWVPELYYKY